MSVLQVWDEVGSLQIDSDYITMGLVKSGNFSYIGSAERAEKVYINSTSYTKVGVYDNIHGFSVTGADSPIVFIRGRAIFQKMVVSENTRTYWFAHASTTCTYYVFDKMKNRGPGAKLQLWNSNGVLTLDTDQPFLNILGAVSPSQPPNRGGTWGAQPLGYNGASVSSYNDGGHVRESSILHSYSVEVGVPCAVYLPWYRSMFHTDRYGNGQFSAREGAFGNGTKVTFMMGTEAGCLMNPWLNPSLSYDWNRAMYLVPYQYLPQALYIDVTDLPIPYSV